MMNKNLVLINLIMFIQIQVNGHLKEAMLLLLVMQHMIQLEELILIMEVTHIQ